MSDSSIQLRSLLSTNQTHSSDPSDPCSSSSDEPGRQQTRSFNASISQSTCNSILLPQAPVSFETSSFTIESPSSLGQSNNPLTGARSASFTRNRPPPLKLVQSAKRFDVTSTNHTINQHVHPSTLVPPSPQRFTDEGSINQSLNQSLLGSSTRHHEISINHPDNESVHLTGNQSALHRLSIFGLILNQILSITVIALCSLWAHFPGVSFACVTFVWGAAGVIIAWKNVLHKKISWITYFVRPVYAIVRIEVIATLITMILLHALHSDPNRAEFPMQCSDPSHYPCVRLDGNATTSDPNIQLQLPMLHSSLSIVRDVLIDHFQTQPGYTVLSAEFYEETIDDSLSSKQDVISVHVRVLNTIFGIPSDMYMKLTCDELTRTTVLAMHSENRVRLPDYGLNVQHIDKLLQFVNEVELLLVPCRGML